MQETWGRKEARKYVVNVGVAVGVAEEGLDIVVI
jgi:ERCC4-related helicase